MRFGVNLQQLSEGSTLHAGASSKESDIWVEIGDGNNPGVTHMVHSDLQDDRIVSHQPSSGSETNQRIEMRVADEHVFVDARRWLVAEDGHREAHALHDRHRREVQPVRHVLRSICYSRQTMLCPGERGAQEPWLLCSCGWEGTCAMPAGPQAGALLYSQPSSCRY